MSSIVYQTDHKTGVKYAYESVSYWDKDKQQPRSKRKYLGRVDPETGEIIAKKERATHSAEAASGSDEEIAVLRSEIARRDERIKELEKAVAEGQKKYDVLEKTLNKIYRLADTVFTDKEL